MNPIIILLMQHTKILFLLGKISFFLENIMWGVFAIGALMVAPYVVKSAMFLYSKIKALCLWLYKG